MKKAIIMLAAMALLAAPAMADMTYDFYVFHNPDGASLVGLDYNVLVSGTGWGGGALTNQVRFRISNDTLSSVAFPGSITAIYFDDGLLGIAGVHEGPGTVAFTEDAIKKVTPPELQGSGDAYFGDNPFVTSSYLNGTKKAFMSADSDSPVSPMGLGAGEYVDITFGLLPGGSVNEVISHMTSGTLRVGIKIQSLSDDISATAVNVPPIPAPAAIGLGVLGLALVGWVMRRLA